MNRLSSILFFAAMLCYFPLFAQYEKEITDVYRSELEHMHGKKMPPIKVTNDNTVDVHFYHLKLKPAIDSSYIEGQVSIHFKSKILGLQNIKLDLQQALVVDEIVGASTFNHLNDSLFISLSNPIDSGQTAVIEIFYRGNPVLAGGIKGLRYNTHGQNEPVIATLSTPFLAHYWFPCKDGPIDKADSVYVDITIPDRVYQNQQLRATSNGLLTLVDQHDGLNTFSWRHRYPIVSYYVMMAISNYVVLEEEYCNNGHCFPLQYHVFQEDTAIAREGIAELPEVMALFESLFGNYPFRDEKYGMTQLGYYGAIENQTNTIINSMSPDWKMVIVHELAHAWFGCQITCADWHHGWLNEGFATYCEALWKEHQFGSNAYSAFMASKGWYQGGTVYLEDVDNPFGVFIPIIYKKGAWILHMLRALMGDEQFFIFLKYYTSLPELAYGHVSTERFQELAEEAYGSSLGTFFDQWVYDEYYPSYYYNFEQTNGQLNVQLFQMQAELGRRSLFEVPVDLLVSFNDFTDTLVKVMNYEQNQLFEFAFGKTVNSIEIDPYQWLLHSATYRPDLPVGLVKIAHSDRFSFRPNPNSGTILLQIDSNVSLPVYVSIYDTKGIEQYRIQQQQHFQLIDLSKLNKGLHIISVENQLGKISRSQKLIVK